MVSSAAFMLEKACAPPSPHLAKFASKAFPARQTTIPVYGPLAVTVEKAGYAVLGELASVLTAGGAAAEAKLADAGLDVNVVATVKAMLASIPQFVTLAKTL